MTNARKTFSNREEMSRFAAELVESIAKRSSAEQGRFGLVLSGGNTPRRLYRLLAKTLPWEQTHLFWGDERWVAKDHPDSNYKMAAESLLSRVPIPAGQIHRIPTEGKSPEQDARDYQAELEHYYQPGIDLVLLGMGGDGHTASLFPDDPGMTEMSRWVISVATPKIAPALPRISVTFPLINLARQVVIMISGTSKISLAEKIIAGDETTADLPAARVRPQGKLLWLMATND